MRYLGKVDNQINSLRSKQEETEDTIRRFQNEIHTLKRGSDETLDYGDKQVIKTRNKTSKKKRAYLA